jgi:hypothetical protein
MHLRFNCDRVLAHIAADATRRPPRPPGEVLRSLDLSQASRRATDSHPPLPEADRLHTRLGELVRVAVVGEPDELHLALADGAVGWSPTGAFTSRDQAVGARIEAASCLAVDAFRIVSLSWHEPWLGAEWRLVARQSEPLLICEDILVEGSDRLVHLCGATIAQIRHDRVVVVHTYFDDAALIEQVLTP